MYKCILVLNDSSVLMPAHPKSSIPYIPEAYSNLPSYDWFVFASSRSMILCGGEWIVCFFCLIVSGEKSLPPWAIFPIERGWSGKSNCKNVGCSIVLHQVWMPRTAFFEPSISLLSVSTFKLFCLSACPLCAKTTIGIAILVWFLLFVQRLCTHHLSQAMTGTADISFL